MTLHHSCIAFTRIAATALLALIATGSLSAQRTHYAQNTAFLSNPTPRVLEVPGLAISLPAASAEYNTAIVTLSTPNLYLSGTASSNTLAGQIAIRYLGEYTIVTVACDTLTTGFCYRPSTIVLNAPLATFSANVVAEWATLFGSTINSSNFASLSVVLAKQ